MKHLSNTLLVFFLVLIVTASKLGAQSVDQLIAEVDNYYKQFNNDKALETIKKAEKIDADNFEVIWRVSRSYVDIAEKMPSSTSQQEDAQLAVYQKAVEYAEKAIKLIPSSSIGFLRRAIANGKIALFKGVFKVGGVVNNVRSDVEKSIQLNTGGNFTQAIAHYVLARTHAKTSEKPKLLRWPLGLAWADNEIALEEYKKAIQLYPTYIMFYVDYANSLMREDEYQAAKEMLNKALKQPIQHQDDEMRLAEAKKMITEINNQ